MNEFIVIGVLTIVAALIFLTATRRRYLVQPWETAALYINGKFERVLEPGRYSIFKPFSDSKIYRVPSYPLGIQTGTLDAASKDKLPFRLAASIVYTVVDTRLMIEEKPDQLILEAVSAAVVHIASQYGLEELLCKREEAGLALHTAIKKQFEAIEIKQAQISSIQLPPEARRLFVELEKAKLESQVRLERARGEQAALRSLANAARLVKDNPELANLRLLQTIEASKGSTTIILGQSPAGVASPEAGK
jgi:regulator of protease activity HflC (stomatin/prohibitin superfamily)